MQSISVILDLNKNDEIYVHLMWTPTRLRDASNHRFTHFMGHLLKQNVGFDCKKNTFTHTTGIITYETANPNHGNSIVASTGIFTAPQPGIYAFHFHGQAYDNGQLKCERNSLAFFMNINIYALVCVYHSRNFY